MSNQEILPPGEPNGRESDRAGDGRWKPGHSGNPNGRAPGQSGEHTVAIKDMVKRALVMVGGEQYLAMCAITQPAAFLGLVGKTMPLVKDEGNGEMAIMVARRVIVEDVAPGAND